MYEILSTLVIVIAVIVALLLVLKIYVIVSCGKCTSQARLDGKTVLITGATSGIGKETAIDIASRGARVVLGCRNLELADKVREEISKQTKNDNIVVYKLDFESLASVRNFSKMFHEHETRLDLLINNAGAGGLGNKTTVDGLHITMQINHFGPFLLTNLLLDMLKSSAPSRIVTVASLAYINAMLDSNDLNKNKTLMGIDAITYSNAKLCNILMSNELARRLKDTQVTSNCLHPGTVKTGLYRNTRWTLKMLISWTEIFYKTPKQGAQTSIHLAVCEKVEGVSGEYFQDCKKRWRLRPARNPELATKVWNTSEKLVKLQNNEMHC